MGSGRPPGPPGGWQPLVSLLLLLFLVLCLTPISDAVMVVEVAEGHKAELECPSNDEHHRFAFWQLYNEQILGPQNPINDYKYKYEVLGGKLFIKGVSTTETGRYTCFSRRVGGEAELTSQTVELLVRKNWDEEYEDDTQVNTFRAVGALSVLLMVLLAVLFALRMRRSRPLRFRDLIDEESPDEAPPPARADVYRPTTLPSSSGAGAGAGGTANSSAKDNLAVAVDTDFPMAFESLPTTLPTPNGARM